MKKKSRRQTRQKATWMIVGAGAAMIAGTLVERSLGAGWKAVTSKNPPLKPELPRKSGWGEALAWTAASAIAIGLAQLMAKRGAALGWEYTTGKHPPV
ncbi:MAG TPA: DUF4235 domain-containing protein [Gemmatimonadaceae bacterium]|jgi:hypothetical protein